MKWNYVDPISNWTTKGANKTDMSNKGLYQLMRKPHVVQNHEKVILRRSQQIRAKDDSQSFGRHMITLFKVCNPVKVSENE
jgi:hypothetical protein